MVVGVGSWFLVMSSIRVDELILPVTAVRLVRGGLEITARVCGPFDGVRGNVRVFDDRGEPVTDEAEGSSCVVAIPPVLAGDVVEFTYSLHIKLLGA